MNKSKAEPKSCDPCARVNRTENVDSWCKNCGEALCEPCVFYHRINKGTLSHQIIPIKELDTDGSALKSVDELCAKHPEENIKAYCADHSSVACMTCVMLTHRKCDSVGSIEDAAKEKMSSKELKDLEESFVNMKEEFEKLRSLRDENVKDFEKNITDLRQELETQSHNIKRHMESLKEKAIQEVNAAEKEVVPDIENETVEIENKLSAINNDISLLRSSKQHAAPAHFMQTFQRLSAQKCSLEKSLQESTTKMRRISIRYTPLDQLNKLQTEITSFGVVSLEQELVVPDDIPKVDMSSVKPELLQEINRPPNCIVGIAYLCDDRIVVSNAGSSLQLLNVDGTLLYTLQSMGSPWEMRMLNDTDGAVAVNSTKLIFFSIHKTAIIAQNKEIKVNVKTFDIHGENII